MQKTINVHKNHRKRVREKFEKVGLAGFAEHEILELLLFYAIPYKDTNPIAHKLINAFGNLQGVFSASKDELMQINGISENSATLIKIIPELMKDLERRKTTNTKSLNSVSESIKYAINLLSKEEKEYVYVICIDRKNLVKGLKQILINTHTYVIIDKKSLTKFILQKGVDRVILTHNHPIGSTLPSHQDINFTYNIMASLKELDIEVLDHIIVNKDGAYSFAKEGLIDQIYQAIINKSKLEIKSTTIKPIKVD